MHFPILYLKDGFIEMFTTDIIANTSIPQETGIIGTHCVKFLPSGGNYYSLFIDLLGNSTLPSFSLMEGFPSKGSSVNSNVGLNVHSCYGGLVQEKS